MYTYARPLMFVFFLTSITAVYGQAPATATAGEHIGYLTSREEILQKNYLSYMSATAHSGARKMEKRRNELITSIKETIKEGRTLKPFKNDATLRDAYVSYWNVLLSIFTEDYHKIIDLEEVAEQSYDEMEKYLLTQEKVSEKLANAHAILGVSFKGFAAANNVRLIEGEDTKLEKKLKQASAVTTYHNAIFLIYFKASVQEEYALKAIKEKNINGLEQSRASMEKYSTEGLQKLDTMRTFQGDNSMAVAVKKMLTFYKHEAVSDIPTQSDFMLKTGEFEKIKKSFDEKPTANRTQPDIDAYNKSINDFNKAVDLYNKTIDQTNAGRTTALNQWRTTEKKFMDNHIPYK